MGHFSKEDLVQSQSGGDSVFGFWVVATLWAYLR